MDRALRGLATFSLCAGPILAAQQATSTQEVRVSSWTYVPPAPIVQVETKLVDVGVVVRDRRGYAIAGLTQNDFKIYDDGKERAITAFSVDTSKLGPATPQIQQDGSHAAAGATAPKDQEAAKPIRYLAMVFDDVNMKNGDVMHVRVAAKRFVKDALQPHDRVAIFTTSKGRVLNFTAETGKLLEVIEKLSGHQRISENGLMPCPRITPYQAYLIVNQEPAALQAAVDEALNCFGQAGHITTTLSPHNDRSQDVQRALQTVRVQAEQTWDQEKTISLGTLDALERIVDHLAEMPGNRVLLLASSGFLAETLEYEQNRIIDRALRSNVVINALDAKGLYGESVVLTPAQTQGLVGLPLRTMIFEATRKGQELQTMISPIAYMAQSTGGLFFHESNDLTLGLQELGALPEVSYRVGFRPDDVADKRYHKLKVKLATGASYIVQARPGYFAATATQTQAAKPQPTGPQEELDREVMATDTTADFPAGVTVEPGQSKTGQPLLWLLIHVDLKHLPFVRQNDRQGERITFFTGLLDADGKLVTGKEGRMDLDLTEATLTRLSQTGINAKISLEAPPGFYRLRAVVVEGVEGKMTASSQAVEIR
jgi:VWFA-related protein